MASRLKSLLSRRRRPQEEAEMDITPMIDCTFLLLIFFLVTSRMKAQAPLDLPAARHGGAVSERDAIILTVAKAGEDVHVFRGNSTNAADRITGADPAEEEDAIRRYVEQQATTAPPKQNVLIKAERGLKHRDVARVQRAASRANVEQLYVAVREAER
jgi:biopolymer transport protein ExbD